ncbi:MAG: hypothetical protein Q4P13_05660 [Psychrobacter sp.]|nr:hypothetical protein [Psychrobacter sp.]
MFIFTLTTVTSGDMSIAPIESGLSTTTLIGFALLTIGVIATALSSQRSLLLYGIGGMVYWLVIEALQSAITSVLPLSSWHGYVAAMGLSWLPVCGWVVARALRSDTITLSSKRKTAAKPQYIEHTPVYDQYEPKFQ